MPSSVVPQYMLDEVEDSADEFEDSAEDLEADEAEDLEADEAEDLEADEAEDLEADEAEHLEIVYICWNVQKVPTWYKSQVVKGGQVILCDSDDTTQYEFNRFKDEWRTEAAYEEEIKGGIHVETPLEAWLR